MTTTDIALVDYNGHAVPAQLHDTITEQALTDWEANWQPFTAQIQGRGSASTMQSSHWDWRGKASVRKGLANAGYSITCEGGLQGMMFVENALHRCQLPDQQGKNLIYVEYLESAPWNQKALKNPPKYAGVGLSLICAAVELSAQEGFRGRIGLHSLPQANGYYTRLGLADLGLGYGYANLNYFELSERSARSFLNPVP
jgi:hypothetical protein